MSGQIHKTVVVCIQHVAILLPLREVKSIHCDRIKVPQLSLLFNMRLFTRF